MAGPEHATGGCLCGAVRYRLAVAPRNIMYCHCLACRAQGSHYAAFSGGPSSALTITEACPGALGWFQRSERARRGFCRQCGSSLFFQPLAKDWTSIAAASLDSAAGLSATCHIFTAEAADYAALPADGLPKYAYSSPEAG